MGKITYRWVVAGNQSGKSQLAAREIAWILTNTHPYWKRPEAWNEPLLILIAGQDRKNMEVNLWQRRLLRYLNASEWKETRQGNSLQHVTNRITGDQILFVSHSDGSDKNRVHMQGYSAHYVWLDEMPGSIYILEELQRRIDAHEGFLIATFTPKLKNSAIKRIVDSSIDPIGKKYSLGKLDNPIYSHRIKAELAKLEGYSESYKRTILYGDWSIGENAVYDFDAETMLVELPEHYHARVWRHVLSVDPALKSKFGLTVWGEDPRSGTWYLVREEYIEGILDPVLMFHKAEDIVKDYNICRRVCDPHESWYLGIASSKGTTYISPYSKNNRKGDLIKNLQSKLGDTIKIPGYNTKLLQEFDECQWSETAENKIVNASSFHLLDTAQYFADLIPKYKGPSQAPTWEAHLHEGHAKYKAKQQKMQMMKGGRLSRRRSKRSKRRRA
jgi:phage terminase large subunit-like protein